MVRVKVYTARLTGREGEETLLFGSAKARDAVVLDFIAECVWNPEEYGDMPDTVEACEDVLDEYGAKHGIVEERDNWWRTDHVLDVEPYSEAPRSMVGCQERVCYCHDPGAWADPAAYPNGCSACGCRRADDAEFRGVRDEG